MTKKFIIIFFILLSPLFSYSAIWEMDSIKLALQGRMLDAIEGVWLFPDDGAKLLIIKETNTTFDIILLDSPQFSIKPGQSIGKATITAKANTYDAHINERPLKNSKIKNSSVILKITDEDVLQFTPYSDKVKLSVSAGKTFRQLFPFLIRANATRGKTPEGLTGAKRIYPFNKTNYKPCF